MVHLGAASSAVQDEASAAEALSALRGGRDAVMDQLDKEELRCARRSVHGAHPASWTWRQTSIYYTNILL